MKDKKLPNLQKESDRLKIKKIINDNEDKKAKILLEIGMMTYSKIRKGELIDSDFQGMSEEIKNMDIEIYTQYLKLSNIDNSKKRITCECGYTAYKNEKFCPQCGNNLMPKEESFVICDNCSAKNELDSNYCGCCGYKIICEKEAIDFNKKEDEVVYDFIENPDYNEINYFEDSEENKEDDEEEILEIEGREFLKYQQVKEDEI